MIKGLWDSGAGMIARGLQQEITANNLANGQTTAFKEDRLGFREMIDGRLILDRQRGAASPENRLRSGFDTRFNNGALRSTNSKMDFALEGPGFFVVETPDGERFTRDGHFFVNPEGFLVNTDGLPVLGTAGRIELEPGPVEMDAGGQLIQNGNVAGTLRLVEFEDPRVLSKLGRALFQPVPQDIQPQAATETRPLQGMLEQSNVETIEQMVRMIEQERSFTFAQRALQLHDENLGKAVSDVGRLQR